MPYLIPIVVGAGAVAAWLWARRKPAPAPKAIAAARLLVWSESDARAAACAAAKEGITTRGDLAQIVAETLYPQWSWKIEPGEQPRLPRQRPIWAKILLVVDSVMATGCDD